MKTWTGKISKKFHRDFQGTKLYSFQLEGSDRWFRTGKEELEQAEQQTITFSEKNSQVLLDTVVEGKGSTASAPTMEETAPVATSGPTTPTSQESSTTSYTGPTVGQRMAWEAARRDATRIVTTALAVEGQGLEVLPWAKNLAKAKRLDLLVEYINRVAKQLMEEQPDE
ncbi:MAG: hypothetical protein ACYTBJ_18505 [Planctomycetota bacterium]|jgi:hypothetical protein